MIRTLKCAALAVMIVFGSANTSFAATQDYRFEVQCQPIKAAHDATISVQITQVSANKPVTNATVTSQTLHMLMGSMDEPAVLHPIAPDEKGNYRFNADLTMYGEWTLDLVAAVPGENEPIKTSLKLQVVK